MTPEHQSGNIASWDALLAFVQDKSFWRNDPWSDFAAKFLRDGIDLGLNRFFRAGQSLTWLLFSTLDHNGIKGEPHVTVRLLPPERLEISYGAGFVNMGSEPEAQYILRYDRGFPTYWRFLIRLWSETTPEPVPEELRASHLLADAPILINKQNIISLLVESQGVNPKRIRSSTTLLRGLGIDGDDGFEFMLAYSKRFNVDMRHYSHENHFGPEAGFNPFFLFFPSWWRTLKPITIQDLINYANAGAWPNE